MPPIRAVLLDLDETLIVEEAAVTEALRAVARRAASGRRLDADELAVAVRRCARALWRAAPTHAYANRVGISSWEALCGRFAGEDPNLVAIRQASAAFRRRAWGDALREQGVRDDALSDELAASYVAEHGPRRVAYPDVVAALSVLRPRYRLALVTNGAPDLQREKARGADLERWFDVVTVSGDLGVGKPDRAVFEHTLRALGVDAPAAVMVGDNLERDVAGAVGVGMHAVWCDRLGKPVKDPPPRHRIASLAELPPLLERLAGA